MEVDKAAMAYSASSTTGAEGIVILLKFNREGISMPIPQCDVHLYPAPPREAP